MNEGHFSKRYIGVKPNQRKRTEECLKYSHYSWMLKAHFSPSIQFPIYSPGFILALQLMLQLLRLDPREVWKQAGLIRAVREVKRLGGIMQSRSACFVAGHHSCSAGISFSQTFLLALQPMNQKSRYPWSEEWGDVKHNHHRSATHKHPEDATGLMRAHWAAFARDVGKVFGLSHRSQVNHVICDKNRTMLWLHKLWGLEQETDLWSLACLIASKHVASM